MRADPMAVASKSQQMIYREDFDYYLYLGLCSIMHNDRVLQNLNVDRVLNEFCFRQKVNTVFDQGQRSIEVK